MRNTTRNLSILAVLFAIVITLSFVSQAQTHDLITGKVVESNTVPLQGSIHPLAKLQNDRGPVGNDEPLGHMFLLLNRSQQQQQTLDAFVDQLHDPKSPRYHQWVTAEEYGQRFGISDSDLHTIQNWLQSKGFTVEEVPPGRTAIIFTGTVGQLRRAFNVDIHKFSWKGQTYQANTGIPTIPAALAPAVIGFKQLHNFPHEPNLVGKSVFKRDGKTGKVTKISGPASVPEITFNYSGSTIWNLGPQDFYTIYNENPLLTSGITGAGVTIAVVEETGLHNNSTNGTGNTDITSFRSAFGLSAYPTTGANSTQGGVNYLNGDVSGATSCTAASTPTSTDEESEALLDAEWSGAVAPNAIIDYVACKTGSGIGSYGTDISATAIVNHLFTTVTATSLSYGTCEASAGTTGKTFYTNLWEQGAAEGITHVVSSGDSGSAGCNQDADYESSNIGVNSMSASAYNISAGGTDFSDVYQASGGTPSTYWNSNDTSPFSSALSYIPEITWGGYCSNPLFASLLQAQGSTTFGTTYTTQAICNSSYATTNDYEAVVGGTGGVSSYISLPTWQSVYSGSSKVSTTFRNQPDIALFASAGWWGHALEYCQSDSGYACTYTNGEDAYYLSAGGTSFVSPQVAGLMALINQKTGSRQGQAAYTLYSLATQEYGTTSSPNSNIANCSGSALGTSIGSSCIFHDIANDTPCVSGGTTMCGTSNGALNANSVASDIVQACKHSSVTSCYYTGSNTYGLSSTSNAVNNLAYQSAQGYDLGTGLGSVNIANLVNAWNTVSAGFTSSTAIGASPNSITPTTSTTLTGTVTATKRGGIPSGTVSFYIGSTSGTNLGSGSLVANTCTGSAPSVVCTASATLSVEGSALSCGSNNIVAYFPGDAANDAASTSSTVAVTVTSCSQTTTTTAVTSSLNPSSYGQGVSFTAVVSGSSPTGTVQFTIDGSNFGSPVTLTSGSATSSSTSTLSVATHTVTAVYSGDSQNLGSTGSLSGGQVVNQATQTIACTNVPSSAAYNSNFTVSCSATSGLAVAYTSSGVCSNSGATYTMTSGTGNCSVIANQAGNTSYSTAPTVTNTVTASKAANTVTFTTPPPSSAEYGSSFTVAASGLGAGAITYTSDGVLCTNNGATYWIVSGSGSCTVTATQAADANYLLGSVSHDVTTEPAASSVSVALTAGANPSNSGSSVTFTATVTSDTGAVKGRRTTKRPKDLNGTVAWSGWATASTDCPTSTVSGNPPETATCTTSNLPTGTDTVTATYTPSDSNHTNVSSAVSQQVNAATNSVTFTTPPPSSAEYGSSFTVAASGLGTGAISYTSDGVVCSNSGATYTMISGTGTCSVTATQAADAIYPQASATDHVAAEPAVGSVSVALTSGSNPSTYGDSVTFTATVTSDTGAVKGRKTTKRPKDLNGSVAWSGNTGCSASPVSGNSPETATCTTSILDALSSTVTATYTASDSNHTTASGSVSQTVNPASQTILGCSGIPASAAYNSSFTASCPASSGLPVSYASSGSCTNSGANYTMTSGTGACLVTVTQAGNNDYSAAPTINQSVNATLATQTVTCNPGAPGTATDHSSFTLGCTAQTTLTYTASGVCTNVGATYTMTSGAANKTCSESVNAAASGNYSSASYSGSTATATPVAPTVSVSAPASAPYNSTYQVVATTNASTTPTFTATPATVCSISGTTVTMLSGTGTCSVKASWAADDVYKAAAATATTAASKLTPTVSFTGAPSSAAYLSTFTVSTTENSSVTPMIKSTTATECSVSAGVVTMKSGAGTCTVEATWAANTDYLAATASQSVTAEQATTTTTITNTVAAANPLKVTVDFSVSNGTATAAVGDVTVTASSGESCTGTAAAGKCVITFVSADAGSQTLTAAYAGNANNSASTSAPFGLTVQ